MDEETLGAFGAHVGAADSMPGDTQERDLSESHARAYADARARLAAVGDTAAGKPAGSFGQEPPSAGGAAEKAAHKTGVELLHATISKGAEPDLGAIVAAVREAHPRSSHSDDALTAKLKREIKARASKDGNDTPPPDYAPTDHTARNMEALRRVYAD